MERFSTFGRRIVWVLAIIGCVMGDAILSVSAIGVGFPEKGKAIQLIVNHPAGGSSDAGARIMAAGMEKELGTPIMVLNKPGAGGQIGMTATASARPDGYVIGCTPFPSAISSYLDPARKALYNRKSFELLALHVIDPGLIAVRAESPFYPGVKTFDAQGYKSVRGFNSRGYMAPAGTPKEIVNILSNAMKQVTSSEEHKKQMRDMGLTLHYMDPLEYGRYWDEYEKMLIELMPLTKE